MLDVRLVAVADHSADTPVVLALPTAPDEPTAEAAETTRAGASGALTDAEIVEGAAPADAPGAVADVEGAPQSAGAHDVADVQPGAGAPGAEGAAVDGALAADADEDERSAPAVLLDTPYALPDGLAATLDAWLGDERRPEPPAKGKAGEVATLPLPGGSPAVVLLVGTGEGAEKDWRKAGAALVRAASGDPEVVLALPTDVTPDAVRGLFEGALLASYRFTLASDPKPPTLRSIRVVTEDPGRFADAVTRARAVANGTVFARDLVNTPSNIKSPEWFADQATESAAVLGIDVQVRDPEWLEANKFGGVLAVGGGSTRGPRLLELRWAPPGVELHTLRHVVLVGKGITFDTGGISIKPAQGMQMMKKDMGGGAAVVGAVLAAAAQELALRVTVLVPLAENMPSGTAYRPGDVVRHYGGRTSEIFSTDAEGRMVLGDALAYAVATLQPDVLIDLATLTGGQSVALGKRTAALFSEDDDLAKALSDAAEQAGERVWQMPLPEDYLEQIDSDVADANNSGGRGAQTATAALFLRPFTGAARDRWVHIDMSGPAWSDGPNDELTKGATGWGARTLARYLESL
ncbi:leucyl aminopeptidase [Cryptosporangium arvum]|uniref:leucyl aminopeptidase n=1 Tax=Cryptosporangium arvum TaxID=80871 RepID=UPI0004AF3319|nr:leucyl aminopeptidase [Cryptosporangium arvum]